MEGYAKLYDARMVLQDAIIEAAAFLRGIVVNTLRDSSEPPPALPWNQLNYAPWIMERRVGNELLHFPTCSIINEHRTGGGASAVSDRNERVFASLDLHLSHSSCPFRRILRATGTRATRDVLASRSLPIHFADRPGNRRDQLKIGKRLR